MQTNTHAQAHAQTHSRKQTHINNFCRHSYWHSENADCYITLYSTLTAGDIVWSRWARSLWSCSPTAHSLLDELAGLMQCKYICRLFEVFRKQGWQLGESSMTGSIRSLFLCKQDWKEQQLARFFLCAHSYLYHCTVFASVFCQTRLGVCCQQ